MSQSGGRDSHLKLLFSLPMFSLLGPGTSTDGKGVVDLLQVPPPSQHRYPVELPPNKIGIS